MEVAKVNREVLASFEFSFEKSISFDDMLTDTNLFVQCSALYIMLMYRVYWVESKNACTEL